MRALLRKGDPEKMAKWYLGKEKINAYTYIRQAVRTMKELKYNGVELNILLIILRHFTVLLHHIVLIGHYHV